MLSMCAWKPCSWMCIKYVHICMFLKIGVGERKLKPTHILEVPRDGYKSHATVTNPIIALWFPVVICAVAFSCI